jgi:cleavage stimulation factor subunit 2
MSTRPPSRVVFVGNIPYGETTVAIIGSRIASHLTFLPGLTEEQITDIFSSAGKVERFRLVYDPETGRPKGFGFADYPDTGTDDSSPQKPVLSDTII